MDVVLQNKYNAIYRFDAAKNIELKQPWNDRWQAAQMYSNENRWLLKLYLIIISMCAAKKVSTITSQTHRAIIAYVCFIAALFSH